MISTVWTRATAHQSRALSTFKQYTLSAKVCKYRSPPLHLNNPCQHQSSTMASSTPTSPLKVLLLGVHMAPGEPFPEEALIKMIEDDAANGLDHGLDIQHRLTHVTEPEYEAIVAKLREQPWDVVAVGAGVRFPKERAALFEWLVNAAVRFVKPTPVLVFNTSPNGVVEACLRVRPQMDMIEKLGQET